MTSEGKSARVSDSIVYLPCGHGKWDTRFDCVTCLQFTVEQLNQALANERIERTMADSAHERESRLSIAAALEMAQDDLLRMAEKDVPRLSNGDTHLAILYVELLNVAHASLRSLTSEQVAHARAEHDAQLVAPVQAALEHDRTKVAECVTAVKKELQAYSWLIEGRGSYEWDDDRWHGEFKRAHDAIEAAIQPMVKIAADWSNCPKTWDAVQTARQRAEHGREVRLAEAILWHDKSMEGHDASSGNCKDHNFWECRRIRALASATEARSVSAYDAPHHRWKTIRAKSAQVEALPAKWRLEKVDLPRKAIYRQCANELEAVLAHTFHSIYNNTIERTEP